MFVVHRSSKNPLLSPQREHPWEAAATFNPSAVHTEDGTRLYYRALGNPDALQTPHAGLSSIGTAFAEDGAHFHSRRQVIAPQEDWDRFGCEDPRATYFEGKWYVFYTALGGYPFGPDNIKVGLAIGDGPEDFTERHLITPFNAKAATLFPDRIDGDVLLLLTVHTDWTAEHPRPTIAIARAKRIEDFFDHDWWRRWHDELPSHALQDLRRADGDHIEVGAAPIKTTEGWLLVYSYIENYYDEHKRVFAVEAALLDHHDPQKVTKRTYPFMVAEEIYETYGMVPRIVFPSGATLGAHGHLDIWYGAADTVCAKASVRVSDLLQTLSPEAHAGMLARLPENPILEPRVSGFDGRAAFNSAAIELEGSIYLLYRAMDAANTSTIGLAVSRDGVHIDERLDRPVYVPRADFELKRGKADGNSGCEDPRIVRIADTLYLTYTAYDGNHAPRGAISSISLEEFLARDFSKWSVPALITPDNVDDKDLCLLPAHLPGEQYLLYHRIDGRVCADILPDLNSGKRVSRCIEIMGPRRGLWDSAKVGIAAPPFKVDKGWLLIYHGVSGRGRYRLGAALLDPSGTSVLARSADPILEPETDYEKAGEIPNVVFSCGAVVRGDELLLYYGGGDKVLAIAKGSFSRLLAALV